MRALNIRWSKAQHKAFFNHPKDARFCIYPKGRRAGFTQGAMQAAITWALNGEHILWGDTIHENIRKYIERYGEPLLKKHKIPYEWNKTLKVIRFRGGGYIDFRSADNPENWEGFAYHRILLNEAGIILEGDDGHYLYKNSVLPMMIDYDHSILYAFGVPKGIGSLYHTLHKSAVGGEEFYYTETFTGYQNPFISKKGLGVLRDRMQKLGGDLIVSQEILGDFVNIHEGENLKVIPSKWVELAFDRWDKREKPNRPPDSIGIDVGRGIQDLSVFAPKWDNYIGELDTFTAKDGTQLSMLLLPRLGPKTKANFDIVGVGTSPYDETKKTHSECHAVNGGLMGVEGRDATGQFGFYNLRAKLHWKLREMLDPDEGCDLALPRDPELLADLTAATWELRGDKIIVEPKKEIKKRLGRSPDRGDAVIYSVYEPPPPKANFMMVNI